MGYDEIVAATTIEGEDFVQAGKVLDAAQAYFDWRRKNGLTGAVLWMADDCGRMVIFTRGEYAEAVKKAIRDEDGFHGNNWPWKD